MKTVKTRRRGARVVAALATASFLLGARSPSAVAGSVGGKAKSVAMSVDRVAIIRGSHVVLLKNAAGNVVVPIWIGAREAQAIQMGLTGILPARPLTHNLLVEVLKKLKARIQRLEVVAIKNKVYIGRLMLRDAKNKRHAIDARPSDLCVLASMKRLKVYVAPSVIQQTGVQKAPPRTPARQPSHI
ncbi:MAG: bifunctional nuclease family protein [bacterium]